MLLKIDTFCIVRTASNSLYLKKRQVKKGKRSGLHRGSGKLRLLSKIIKYELWQQVE